MTDRRATQHRRERLLYRYHNALDRGDFATVADVLEAARHDAELAAMIEALNGALAAEARPAMQPGRPAATANGHQKTDDFLLRGEQTMTVNLLSTITTAAEESPAAGRSIPGAHRRLHVRRWQTALPLLAALIVVALMAGLLALNQRGSGITPVGGPGEDPAGLPGAAQQGEPTSTPLPTDPVVVTATPVPTLNQGILSVTPTMTFLPTMLHTPVPSASPTHTATPFSGGMMPGGMGMVPRIVVGSTLSGILPTGQDLVAYNLVAEQAGEVRLVAVSPDFAPRLLAVLLDDDLAVLTGDSAANQSALSIPLAAGDRALVLVAGVSGDRDAGGQFLLSAANAP